MKVSGTIRRTGVKPCRLVISRASCPLFAWPDGTAHRVPEAHHSEPGFFFPVAGSRVLCKVPRFIPSQDLYFITHLAGTDGSLGKNEEQLP